MLTFYRYPPTTYAASPGFNNASSAASYRGGYPAATAGPTNFNPGGVPNGQANKAPNQGGPPTSSAAYSNGSTATSGANTSAALAAMANLSLAK